MDKQFLRNELRKKRALLSLEERKAANQKIRERFEKILQQKQFSKESVLYFYVSIHTEVDTRELLAYFLKEGYRIAVPKVTNQEAHEMKFYEIFHLSDLEKGFHGIYEPVSEGKKELTSNGIMIVPGLGFTKQKDRLGYGGGFYDSYFSRLNTDIFKVAFAYECQMVSELPIEETDHKIDMIITEETIYD